MNVRTTLIDRKKLGEIHPALKNKNRLDWLIRTRKIPIVKFENCRTVYFDENEINRWITENLIEVNGGQRK